MGSRPRRRMAGFVFLMLVALSLSFALWQYHQMVVAVFDGASGGFYRSLLRPFSSQPDTLGLSPIRVAVVGPDAADADQAAQAAAVQWEEALARQGFVARRLHGVAEQSDLALFNVIVVPGGVRLDEGGVDRLLRFAREGGGLILSWAAGARDSSGRWRPSRLLQHIGGLDLASDRPGSDADRLHVELHPRSPLIAGIEPGFTMALTRFDQPVYAVAREPRATVAGSWTAEQSFARRLSGQEEPVRQRAILVHGDYHQGRFFWMGFTVASGVSEPEQSKMFGRLLRNAVVWTARQPMIQKDNWPDGAAAAFILAWRLEGVEDYDERLPDLARAYGVPLTTYLSPSALALDADVLEELAALGSIGFLYNPDADAHSADQTPTATTWREWRKQVAAFNQDSFAGCLVSGAVPDSDTWLDLMAAAGFDFVVRPDFAHLLPRLVRSYRSVPILARARELWSLPDIAVSAMSRPKSGGSGDLAGAPVLFEAVRLRGGLLHLSLVAGQIDDEAIVVLDRLLALVKREKVWATTSGQALDFYRIWGHVTVAADYPTPSRFVVQVGNAGTRTASDLTVYLHMAEPQRGLSVTPTTLGSPSVHAVSDDGYLWRFDISAIQPGKNFIYHAYREPVPGR